METVRWEYLVLGRSDRERLPGGTYTEQLNHLGRDGWELVLVSERGDWYLKRPMRSGTSS